MDTIQLVKLSRLMKLSTGNPNIKIGVIDGPVDFSHPDFSNLNFRTIHQTSLEKCKNSTSLACKHGTLVTGIMASSRGSPSLAICPNCTFILNPIFSENQQFPVSTPEELARAIIETVDAGVNIINLSVGLSTSSIRKYAQLEEAMDYAILRKVLLIIAAGNQSKIAVNPSFDKINTILVVACDQNGFPTNESNLGWKNGPALSIMAPGVNIISTSPDKSYLSVSGTSIAAAIVTGTMALVASILPRIKPLELKNYVCNTNKRNRTIIPPLLNAQSLYEQASTVHANN